MQRPRLRRARLRAGRARGERIGLWQRRSAAMCSGPDLVVVRPATGVAEHWASSAFRTAAQTQNRKLQSRFSISLDLVPLPERRGRRQHTRVLHRGNTEMRSSVAAVLLLAHEAQSHAMLTVPTGRPHVIDPNGPKLTPFSDARYVANRGCGGVDNGGETVIMPSLNPATNVFIAGSTIEIKWKLTIPHNADNRDTGIRVSLHYEENDSFECNILGGGLDGDPGFHPVQEGAANPRVLSAGPDDAVTNQEVSTLVTLPDKTCDYCVLQWAWAARSDGGFYISCADIAITTDGRPASPRRPADALAWLPCILALYFDSNRIFSHQLPDLV